MVDRKGGQKTQKVDRKGGQKNQWLGVKKIVKIKKRLLRLDLRLRRLVI